MIWDSIQAVIVIFVLIGAGVFVAWRKWVPPQVAGAFPKVLVNLAVPCMVIYHFYTSLSRERVFEAWLPLLVLAVAYPVSYFLGRFFAVLVRVPKTRRGVFTVLFSFSNSMFIGFPVAQALFGDPGMPYAMYFFLVNTTFFWVLGYHAIRRDADIIHGVTSQISVMEILKKLATPPIITILAMFAVVMLQIPLPFFVLSAAGYMGSLTTPLSLIFMGCVIYEAGPEGLKIERNIGPVLIGRFALIPAVCFIICQLAIMLFPFGGPATELVLMRNVLTVQAGLPVMTQTVILSQLYGADVPFATKSFIWTTLVSVVTIPAYMVLFQYI
jgi:hypothetical protein